MVAHRKSKPKGLWKNCFHTFGSLSPLQSPSTKRSFARTSTNTKPVSDDPDFYAANKAEEEKNYAEMLKHCQILVRRYPKSNLAFLKLGIAYDYLHFTDEAKAARHRADEIDQLGLESCRQAVKLKPDDAKAWCKLADAYLEKKLWDEAISACQQAVKLQPNDFDVWWDVATIYRCMERVDEAVAAFRRGMDIKPDVASGGWFLIGQCYQYAERTEDAIAAYRQTIKLKPDDGQAWFYLGVSCEKAGRRDDAIAAYHRLVELEPNYAEAWYNLGTCLKLAGRTDGGEEALAKARKLKPELFK